MVKEIKGEVISIGDELITGKVGNSTAAFAAQKLTENGFYITRITAIGDDPLAIKESLKQAIARSDFVIISGGLGPTTDDITNEAVSQGLGLDLKFQPGIFRRVMDRAGGIYSEEMGKKLASLPEGAKELNPNGYAAGYLLIHQQIPLFFLPGVPEQMKDHLINRVLPWLKERFPNRPYAVSQTLITFGLSESEINQKLVPLTEEGVQIGYYPRFPEVHVVMTSRNIDPGEASRRLSRSVNKAKDLLGAHVISSDGACLEEVLGEALMAKGFTLAIAESCTGGLIASRVTAVPGSSRWFDRGVVTYSNRAKEEFLGVSPTTLATFGAVSRETASEMIRGLLARSNAECAVAVTGIAGPSGGTPSKPVGTVYIAAAMSGPPLVYRFHFKGDRREIQAVTATTALDWLRRMIQYDTDLPGYPPAE